MSITVPAAGDPVTATWGASVANLLNQFIPLCMTADVATTSATPVDVTGLSFPVVSGDAYNIQLCGQYTVGGVNTGLGFTFDLSGGATGTTRLLSEIMSSAVDDTTPDTEWLSVENTGTGTATTDSTASHFWSLRGRFVCTASGTFTIQVERNGTSTTVTILQGSGGIVVATA